MRLNTSALTDKEEALRREQKKLDNQLELEYQRELAKIRATEVQDKLRPVVDMVHDLASSPPPNYTGVRDLYIGDSKDVASKLLSGLVTKVSEALGPEEKSQSASSAR